MFAGRRLMVTAGLLLALAPPSALALDCVKPQSEGDRIVCADPKLKPAYDAMEAAYRSAYAVLEGRQRELLVSSQRKWLREHGRYGQGGLSMIDRRRKFLAPEPLRATGRVSRLVPHFVLQSGDRSSFPITYELVRFLKPQSPGEALFNAEIDRLVAALPLGPRRMVQYPESFRHEFHGWAMVTSVSPGVLQAFVTSDEVNVLASNVNAESRSILIDLAHGALVKLDDLFDRPARTALREDCLKQILVQRKRRLDEAALHIRAEFITPVREAIDRRHRDMARIIARQMQDIGAWRFGTNEAELSIGGIGGYKWDSGHSCTFAMADIRRLAKPGAPLPE